MTKTKIIAITFGSMLALCGLGTVLNLGGQDGPAPATSTSTMPVPRPEPLAQGDRKGLKVLEKTDETYSASPIPAPGVGPGMYLVGQDVPSGTYETPGAKRAEIVQLCYGHTARDASDDTIVDQIVTNEEDAPQVIILKKGQYFKTSGCQRWIKQ